MSKRLGKFLGRKNNLIRSTVGFSLPELMITVAIVGALVAVAIPSYKKMQIKSIQSEAKSDLADLSSMMNGYNNEYGQFTTRLDAINYLPNGKVDYVVGFANDVPNALMDFVKGTPGCNWTGVPDNSCKWGLNPWKLSDKASAVPGVPGTVATITSYTAYALGKANGIGIDSWSIDNNRNLLNLNPQ